MLVRSELHDEMENIVLDSKLIEAINNASKITTSEIESFHSCLNRNAPKMEGFSYSKQLSR